MNEDSKPDRVRESICYFVESAFLSEHVGESLEDAIKFRDRCRPGGIVTEQRSRMEWREVA